MVAIKEILPGIWLTVVKDEDGWRFGQWRKLPERDGIHYQVPAITETQQAMRFETEDEAFDFFRQLYQTLTSSN